jgi:O-antigen ligase
MQIRDFACMLATMRKPVPLAAPATARTAFATAGGWTLDTQAGIANTAMVCALLLFLILPPNLDFAALLDVNATTGYEQSMTTKLVMLGLFFVSLVLIAQRPKLWWELLVTINPGYTLFLGLAALSLLWSIDAGVTAAHEFRLLVTLLCCSAFTLTGWHRTRFQSVVRALLGAVLVGSVLFAVLLPHFGVQQFYDYTTVLQGSFATRGYALAPDTKPVLRGLTLGKNQMGQLASLGVVFWFHAWLGKEARTSLILLCGSAALICLAWSHSSTSMLAAAFSVLILLMLRHWPRWLRRYTAFIVTLFTVVVLAYSLVVLKLIPQLEFLLSPISLITGKDLTFTSRTAIWQVINAHIIQHPILGTGYSAYWTAKLGSASQEMKRLLYFYPGEAHNGYLDVINDLGIVGGLCLLLFFFKYLSQSLKILTFDRPLGALYLALLFHQFFSNLSESHWFHFASVPFAIVCLAVCTSARTLLQHRFDLQAPKAQAEPQPQPKGTVQRRPRTQSVLRR